MSIKAYKGFNKDMTCRGFKFEEGKEYHEEKAVLCSSGFHACENPLDCWSYYDIISSEYHEVELDDVCEECESDTKICGKSIKIGAKINLAGIVKASVDFVLNSVKDVFQTPKDSGDDAQIGSSGDDAQIGSSGQYAQIGSSGDAAKIGSSGDAAKIGSSGRYAKIGSSGQYAQIGSSGDDAKIECSADHAVVVCAGKRARIKAPLGTWITLSEYGKWNGEGYPCICVKSAQIDGEILKPDIWYKLENGEFVECEENKQ